MKNRRLIDRNNIVAEIGGGENVTFWVRMPYIGYFTFWGYIGKATNYIELRRNGAISLGGIFITWGANKKGGAKQKKEVVSWNAYRS